MMTLRNLWFRGWWRKGREDPLRATSKPNTREQELHQKLQIALKALDRANLDGLKNYWLVDSLQDQYLLAQQNLRTANEVIQALNHDLSKAHGQIWALEHPAMGRTRFCSQCAGRM